MNTTTNDIETIREHGARLQRLAAFAPAFRETNAEFGNWAPETGKGTAEEPYQLPWFQYGELGSSFLEMLYKAGWVLGEFNWSEWAHGPEGQGFFKDHSAIADADEEQLAKTLTALARQGRFAEGTLFEAFRSGLLLAIAERAEVLCAAPSRATPIQPITPSSIDVDLLATAPIRYIKLVRAGSWAARALAQGEIHLGHDGVPHELAATGDRDAIIAHLIGIGRSQGKARDFAREILNFYQLPEQTIWITFEGGSLWWAQAKTEVVWLGKGEHHGMRMRRTIHPWRNTDLEGRPLKSDSLSTRLTASKPIAPSRMLSATVGASGRSSER